MRDAFEVFINYKIDTKYTTAEMIAGFADRLLRTGGERNSAMSLDEQLERIVDLFSFISDKDMFADIFRGQLAKRLLNERSASDDAERGIISKLKLRCGAQYTAKMEGMIRDLSISLEQKRLVRQLPVDVSVQVLTTGFWPNYRAIRVTLPPLMASARDLFMKYYRSKNTHKKISWAYALGTALVRGNFARSYDFQVHTLQAVALLAINEAPGQRLSFKGLQESTGMEEDVLKRVCHSLSCAKYKVVTPDDVFEPNTSFSCQLLRVRIPMASLEESQTHEKVEEDRTYAIEACIVSATALSPDNENPEVIKRRIEHLIERDYLERADEDPNLYKYVA
ncbi:CUL1 [Symbiodinium sp. KB8]|nr:CUL1 [Symbiodinium sp. KB8]